jgi:arsenate reductase
MRDNAKGSVLFLCTGNSCRGQMAEGLLRHFAGQTLVVMSAGTQPAGLNPDAVAVMREIGIDISHQYSKSVECLQGQHFDYVITVCDRAKETCPTFPKAGLVVHWTFDDPAAVTGSQEERHTVFRRVRDEIADDVRELLRRENRGSG